MTLQEHLLTIAAEECVETAQRISKAIRFGLTEVQPGLADNPLRINNEDRIREEYTHIVAMMDMLGIKVGSREAIQAKKHKVQLFLAYSEKCGTLTP